MKKNTLDESEFELPETEYIRDIDDRVFQKIVLQVLQKIEGITLVHGNFIQHLLGRNQSDKIKGISISQDHAHHSVEIKIEVNICYGESIPEKSEEIQMKITKEIAEATGLHVSKIHVIFKNMVTVDQQNKLIQAQKEILESESLIQEKNE